MERISATASKYWNKGLQSLKMKSLPANYLLVESEKL